MQTKDEYIAWCISDESPKLGNVKVIFEDNDLAVGTHSAVSPEGMGRDVMFFGQFKNHKVTEWKV